MAFKKFTGKELLEYKLKKEKEKMDKLYQAKKLGREIRKQEKVEKSFRLTNLPDNLQQITTKGDNYGTDL